MIQALLPLTAIALAVLAGCSSLPTPNARLVQAHADLRSAQSDPSARDLAPAELRVAGEATSSADAAFEQHAVAAEVDHLAYIASQRAAIATQIGSRRAAEVAVVSATAEREQLRLAARTREADGARRTAQAAQSEAAAAQRQTAIAMREATRSRQQADASLQQAGEADRRSALLLDQLRELHARKTDRGMVITLSDVLFDTNRAQLRPSGARGVEKLAGFLKEHPQRQVLIEGFTDSTGSDSHNQELSSRRADAVRDAMVALGVTRERLSTHGYGEDFPVADNESAGGRQMNRRVEIIVSDDERGVSPR